MHGSMVRMSVMSCILLASFTAIVTSEHGAGNMKKEFDFPQDCQLVDKDFKALPTEYRCDCVRHTAADRDGLFNYMEFQYCTMASSPWLSVALLTLWLMFLFYLIAGTTDEYLVPALTVGVEVFHISPNVAGATILAFANGAPELFTSIATFSKSTGDNDLGIGSLLGGGIFITTFTFGCVILTSTETLVLSRMAFFRDIVFYSAAMTLFFFIYRDGKVHIEQCVVFLAMYIVYVLMVVLGKTFCRQYKRLLQKYRVHGALVQEEVVAEAEIRRSLEAKVDDTLANNGDYAHHVSPCTGAIGLIEEERDERNVDIEEIESMKQLEEVMHLSGARSRQNTSELDDFALKKKKSHGEWFCNEVLGWNDRSLLGRILSVAEFPFTIARRCTVPLVEEDRWSRPFNAISMLFWPSLAFAVMFPSQRSNYKAFLGLLALGVVCASTAWFTTEEKAPTSRFIRSLFVCIAFAVSAMWVYLAANEIVDVMQCIGLGMNISSTVLGATVLAWGNSIGDFIADVSLAKKGHGKMAAAECFGGPMFNLMIGGGVGFLLACIREYPQPFLIPNQDRTPLYGFLFIALSMVSTGISVPLLQTFRMEFKYGIYLILVYAVFMVISVLSESQIL